MMMMHLNNTLPRHKGVQVARRLLATKPVSAGRNVVLVDGVRTPFCLSGTEFKELQAHDLGRMAMHGLLGKTGLNPKDVEYVCTGVVIQEAKTSNVSRESALQAGIPDTVPCHTVTMACISSNQAITSVADMIRLGQIDVGIAAGVETMSDVPIRFSRDMRKRMLAASKVKSPAGYLGLLKGFGLHSLAPELPAIAEFSTGETMGHSADRLAARFGVTRLESDTYAMRSHHAAAKAQKDGLFAEEVLSVTPAPKFQVVSKDNIVRGDTTLEKLSSLKPAFVKPHGTITAGNASSLTDGGSAVLLMSEERALALGYTPLAYLRDAGPQGAAAAGATYATARLLARNPQMGKDGRKGLNMVDVFEFHEAFAGQILANLKALDSEKFCKENIGMDRVGAMPMERFNLHGGSLSLGHPFGATGCRLLTTTARRLIREGGQFGTACAAGGHGHGMIIERYSKK
eukprot:CAMPEP_0177662752 /NCGR_PEP_ID=MMETSP0447-20121125/19492_1 /TAXON_ID=0 /ORGANISM="Stygamoeba regulata, Strain BSH-02190019" /LENGTH=457 /DNA_ID=CAMNT_0019168407 /DNA_START=140 /DNA_END=1514 /DNA_ORIENTATION=+